MIETDRIQIQQGDTAYLNGVISSRRLAYNTDLESLVYSPDGLVWVACTMDGDSIILDGQGKIPLNYIPDSVIVHNHDDRYFTESETNNLLSNKSDVGHTHSPAILEVAPISDAPPSAWPGSGLYGARVYNQGYPSNFGNVISIDGLGRNQIFVGWSGVDSGASGLWFRNKRDNHNGWSPWQRALDTVSDAASITNWDLAASNVHSHSNKANLDSIDQGLNSSNSPYWSSVRVGTSGIAFPFDAFGGGLDSAGMRLVTKGGEAQSLEVYVTNDADDWFNIVVPDVNAAKVNGYTVWNHGNFEPANKSDVGHTHDDRYYTESETNSLLAGKSDVGHNHNITLSGDASGSGSTAITVAIANSAVISKLLTGYVVGANTAITATDSILAAFQKVQGQINSRLTSNQTITLSGVVTGSGKTAIATAIADNALSIAKTSGLQTALDARMVIASNPDLVAIEALAGTSGILRKTATNTWALDTNAYLLSNGKSVDSDLFDGMDSNRFVFGDNGSATSNTGASPFSTIAKSGFYNGNQATDSPIPTSWTHLIHSDYTADDNWAWQLAANFEAGNSEEYYTRIKVDGSYKNWRKIWTTKDISQANVDSWNLCYSNVHSHSNKSNLDSINQNLGTTSSPTFDKVYTTSNGSGSNIKIGDDAWIGDCDWPNVVWVTGGHDWLKGYVRFGNDTNGLGFNGSYLTYSGPMAFGPAGTKQPNQYAKYVFNCGGNDYNGIDVFAENSNKSAFISIGTQSFANSTWTIQKRDDGLYGTTVGCFAIEDSSASVAMPRWPIVISKGDDGNILLNRHVDLYTGKRLSVNKDVDPSIGDNPWTEAAILVNRTSVSGSDVSNVAGIGFHNQGVNASFFYYDPATSSFKYRRHSAGPTLTILDSGSFNPATKSDVGHYHTSILNFGAAPNSSNNPSDWIVAGLCMNTVYNQDYPSTYGNVLTMAGTGGTQIFQGWSGANNGTDGMWFRNHRDNFNGWSPWQQVMDTTTYGQNIINWNDAWAKVIQSNIGVDAYQNNDSHSWQTRSSNRGTHFGRYDNASNGSPRYLNYNLIRETNGTVYGMWGYSSDGEWYVGKAAYNAEIVNYNKLWHTGNLNMGDYATANHSHNVKDLAWTTPLNNDILNHVQSGVSDSSTGSSGIFGGWAYHLKILHSNNPANWQFLLAADFFTDSIGFRRKENGSWLDPRYLWHNGNLTQASIDGWNLAASNVHSHSNKAHLDTINQNLGVGDSPSFAGLNVGSVSNAELQYLDGLTANVQSQLNQSVKVINSVAPGTYLTASGTHHSVSIPGNTFNSSIPVQFKITGAITVNYVGGSSTIDISLNGTNVFSHTLTASGDSANDTFEIDFICRYTGSNYMEVHGLCKMANVVGTVQTPKMRVVAAGFTMAPSSACDFVVSSTISGTATASMMLAKVTKG